MSDVGVREWLESRVPPPPEALADILASAVGETRCAAGDVPAFLVREAQRLIATLGAGRDSAHELLAADALITYALEWGADNAANIEDVARSVMRTIAGITDGGGEGA